MSSGRFVLNSYEEAIRYFDRALRGRSHSDLGTSVMALTGRARVPGGDAPITIVVP